MVELQIQVPGSRWASCSLVMNALAITDMLISGSGCGVVYCRRCFFMSGVMMRMSVDSVYRNSGSVCTLDVCCACEN